MTIYYFDSFFFYKYNVSRGRAISKGFSFTNRGTQSFVIACPRDYVCQCITSFYPV